jgi:hypothetical protein
VTGCKVALSTVSVIIADSGVGDVAEHLLTGGNKGELAECTGVDATPNCTAANTVHWEATSRSVQS